jgi:2-oxoglutarate dehydrogenase E2 component (dihydrolipoamide succinyltransferase)
MILEMKVPSPGESITEVEIAEWLVQDGDYVEKDQAIAEVDSDKATLELPAEVSGTITLKAEEGDACCRWLCCLPYRYYGFKTGGQPRFQHPGNAGPCSSAAIPKS